MPITKNSMNTHNNNNNNGNSSNNNNIEQNNNNNNNSNTFHSSDASVIAGAPGGGGGVGSGATSSSGASRPNVFTSYNTSATNNMLSTGNVFEENHQQNNNINNTSPSSLTSSPASRPPPLPAMQMSYPGSPIMSANQQQHTVQGNQTNNSISNNHPHNNHHANHNRQGDGISHSAENKNTPQETSRSFGSNPSLSLGSPSNFSLGPSTSHQIQQQQQQQSNSKMNVFSNPTSTSGSNNASFGNNNNNNHNPKNSFAVNSNNAVMPNNNNSSHNSLAGTPQRSPQGTVNIPRHNEQQQAALMKELGLMSATENQNSSYRRNNGNVNNNNNVNNRTDYSRVRRGTTGSLGEGSGSDGEASAMRNQQQNQHQQQHSSGDDKDIDFNRSANNKNNTSSSSFAAKKRNELKSNNNKSNRNDAVAATENQDEENNETSWSSRLCCGSNNKNQQHDDENNNNQKTRCCCQLSSCGSCCCCFGKRAETTSFAASFSRWANALMLLFIFAFVITGVIIVLSFRFTGRTAMATSCVATYNCSDLPDDSDVEAQQDLFVPNGIIGEIDNWLWGQCLALVASGRKQSDGSVAVGTGLNFTLLSTDFFQVDSVFVKVSRSVSSQQYQLVLNRTTTSNLSAPFSGARTFPAGKSVVMKDALSADIVQQISISCSLQLSNLDKTMKSVLNFFNNNNNLDQNMEILLTSLRATRLQQADDDYIKRLPDNLLDPADASCLLDGEGGLTDCENLLLSSLDRTLLWIIVLIALAFALFTALLSYCVAAIQVAKNKKLFFATNRLVEEITASATIMSGNWGSYKYDQITSASKNDQFKKTSPSTSAFAGAYKGILEKLFGSTNNKPSSSSVKTVVPSKLNLDPSRTNNISNNNRNKNNGDDQEMITMKNNNKNNKNSNVNEGDGDDDDEEEEVEFVDLSENEIIETMVETIQGRGILIRKIRAKQNLETLLSFVPRAVRNQAVREICERDYEKQLNMASGAHGGGGGGAFGNGDDDDFYNDENGNDDDPILLSLPSQQQQNAQRRGSMGLGGGSNVNSTNVSFARRNSFGNNHNNQNQSGNMKMFTMVVNDSLAANNSMTGFPLFVGSGDIYFNNNNNNTNNFNMNPSSSSPNQGSNPSIIGSPHGGTLLSNNNHNSSLLIKNMHGDSNSLVITGNNSSPKQSPLNNNNNNNLHFTPGNPLAGSPGSQKHLFNNNTSFETNANANANNNNNFLAPTSTLKQQQQLHPDGSLAHNHNERRGSSVVGYARAASRLQRSATPFLTGGGGNNNNNNISRNNFLADPASPVGVSPKTPPGSLTSCQNVPNFGSSSPNNSNNIGVSTNSSPRDVTHNASGFFATAGSSASPSSPFIQNNNMNNNVQNNHNNNNQQQQQHEFTHVRLAPGSIMRRRRCSGVFCQLHFDSSLQRSHLPAISELLDQFVFDVSNTAKEYNGVVVEWGFGQAFIQWNGFTPYGLHETQACLCALALAGHFQHYEENPKFQQQHHHQSHSYHYPNKNSSSNPFVNLSSANPPPPSQFQQSHNSNTSNNTNMNNSVNNHSTANFSICVNSGIMTVGLCGTVGNLSPFCIGDAVNHMKYGAELGRMINCRVIALHDTIKTCNSRILTAPVDIVSFDNGAAKTVVHELRGDAYYDASGSNPAQSLSSFSILRGGQSAEESAARPFYMKGFMYLSQSRYEEAFEHFQKAETVNPADYQIQRLLGVCYSYGKLQVEKRWKQQQMAFNNNNSNPNNSANLNASLDGENENNNNNNNNRKKEPPITIEYLRLAPAWIFPEIAAENLAVQTTMMINNQQEEQEQLEQENNNNTNNNNTNTPDSHSSFPFVANSAATPFIQNAETQPYRDDTDIPPHPISYQNGVAGRKQSIIMENGGKSPELNYQNHHQNNNNNNNNNNNTISLKRHSLSLNNNNNNNSRNSLSSNTNLNAASSAMTDESGNSVEVEDLEGGEFAIVRKKSNHNNHNGDDNGDEHNMNNTNNNDYDDEGDDENKSSYKAPSTAKPRIRRKDTAALLDSTPMIQLLITGDEDVDDFHHNNTHLHINNNSRLRNNANTGTNTEETVDEEECEADLLLERKKLAETRSNTMTPGSFNKNNNNNNNNNYMTTTPSPNNASNYNNTSKSPINNNIHNNNNNNNRRPTSKNSVFGNNSSANNNSGSNSQLEDQDDEEEEGIVVIMCDTPEPGSTQNQNQNQQQQNVNPIVSSNNNSVYLEATSGGGGSGSSTNHHHHHHHQNHSCTTLPPTPETTKEFIPASTSHTQFLLSTSTSSSTIAVIPNPFSLEKFQKLLCVCQCDVGRFVDREGRKWTAGNSIDGRCTDSFSIHTGVSATDGSLAELTVFHIPDELIELKRKKEKQEGNPNNNNNTPTTQQILEELTEEARQANSLRHSCIQSCLSVALTPDQKHFVLIKETCGGGTLADLLSKFGSLGITALRRFAQDIAKALQVHHSARNAAHGALDCRNILLSVDGFCKLVMTGANTVFMTAVGGDEFVAPELLNSDLTSNNNNNNNPSSATTSLSSHPGSNMNSTTNFYSNNNNNKKSLSSTTTLPSPSTTTTTSSVANATFAGDVWSYGIVLCYMYSGISPYIDTLEAMENGILEPSVSLRQRIASKQVRPINPVKATGADGPGAVAQFANSSISKLDFSSGSETEEMLSGLINQCLHVNPSRRCTVQQILSHPFFLI